MDLSPFQQAFADRLSSSFASEAVLDDLSDIVYFIKDDSARYVSVNQTLVDRSGLQSKSELLGKTSVEIFGDPIGVQFLAQDVELIRSGCPLISQLEQHRYPSQRNGWCLTTKRPLQDSQGAIIGLVGLSRDLQSPDEESGDLEQLAKMVGYAKANLEQALRTSELANMTGMSAYQLDRRCRQVYGLSPSQLILQLRMDAAANRLTVSNETIVSIALSVGYSDQSAFTRQFRRTFGISPGKYRV